MEGENKMKLIPKMVTELRHYIARNRNSYVIVTSAINSAGWSLELRYFDSDPNQPKILSNSNVMPYALMSVSETQSCDEIVKCYRGYVELILMGIFPDAIKIWSHDVYDRSMRNSEMDALKQLAIMKIGDNKFNIETGEVIEESTDDRKDQEDIMKVLKSEKNDTPHFIKKEYFGYLHGEVSKNRSVMKDWTTMLSWKAQTVLISSIRGCDAVGKNDISKKIIRKLRATVLNNAGPEGAEFITSDITESELYDFSKNIDAYPVHFLLHLIHACEIIGYEYYEDEDVQKFFMDFYHMMVSSFHMEPESREKMHERLKDGVETCCHKT